MTDVQDPPASGGSKTFGIHKYDPRSCLGGEQARENVRRGYEGKYEDDPLYEELGDEARIWRVMLDEGRIVDAAMLQRFRDHLDVDLVFAGLFSAVLTTFVVQTSQTPSTTGDTTIALLLEIIAIQRAWANDPRVDGVASFSPPPPAPSPSPWINRCWFLSLIFSLLAAFGAVVVRQWLQEYESDIAGPPKRRALVRHFRRVGLENYKVHVIVPILPMLLHVSLLLFFIGLILYVGQSDPTMSHGIIALTTLIYLLYIVTNVLPVFDPQCPYRSPLSTAGYWAKSLYTLLYARLPSVPRPLRRGVIWAEYCVLLPLYFMYAILRDGGAAWERYVLDALKMPSDHEWDTALQKSDDLIPDSLDWAMQASPDLSIAPLVVQASAGLRYEGRTWWSSTQPHTRLLCNRILPWFYNALSTRRAVFDWAPGRENELIRMADSLLLVPISYSFHQPSRNDIDTVQYRLCTSRVSQALTLALLDLPNTPAVTTTDVARMSATLLALQRILNCQSLTRNDPHTVLETIAQAYSLLKDAPPVTGLRLRPLTWNDALLYLSNFGTPKANICNFAITLWRNCTEDWEIAINRLLCPSSCEAYEMEDNADGNTAFDDNLGFLVVQFTGSLLSTLGYDSIDSALRTMGLSVVSAAFKSTFLVRPSLSFAGSVQLYKYLPATFAVSLFWFLARFAREPVDHKVTILNALSRHATKYCEVIAQALDYDEVSIKLLLSLVSTVLCNHQLAFLDISDALATSLATQLSKVTGSVFSDQPENVMTVYLYLDALCAARAKSKQVDTRFPDASRKLHSALRSLKPTYHNTWKQQLDRNLRRQHIPLTVALALKSTHGHEALGEWLNDLPFLVQDPGSGLEVWVPVEAREGDLNWYRHFTSNPDKHIRAQPRDRRLHISELVSFDEAVERMKETDAERAAGNEQGGSGGCGAEAGAIDDAESSGREPDGLDDQGGAERTQIQIVARLRALGAWGVAPFKRVRPFLVTYEFAH
uniref:DUF6535 domain-containing protein n=1 Tax=Schizophyllum commune (strain H4-8 / FGSC 9210) TaxID=578458 RepID=D8QK46_SCHCM